MIPSSSHNRTGNGGSGFSYEWLARGVALIIILELHLQLRFFFPGLPSAAPSAKARPARWTPYDPVGTPHTFHL